MPATKTTEKKPEIKAKNQKFSGVVVSDKMKDTIVVSIERYERHAKYQKYMTSRTRLQAHDAGNTKKVGDKVTIEACRPMSKNKAFKVVA